VSNCGVAHRVNSAESRLARAQYLSSGHYVFIADGVYDFDHRVAGSSHVGCKTSSIADLQPILIPEKQRAKKPVIGFLNFTRLGFRRYADKSAHLLASEYALSSESSIRGEP
jgi:hypothetical protein